jgi:SAM-dependent methyltransferase
MTEAPRPVEITQGSPERFGYSWDRFSEILPIHEEQFRRWTQPFTPADWHGKRILDGGCGIGRNSFWPLRYGAASAVLIDVDQRSLARARANLAGFGNAEIRFHSLYESVEPGDFDIAFSIGVVHHLEHPALAVQRLAEAVKPGGQVLVWLYGRENNGWIVWLATPMRRLLFSWLPLPVVDILSWPVTALLWVMLRFGLGGIEYFRLIRRFSFRHLRAIVFDHMIPKIALYYRKGEAIALLREAGLIEVTASWVNKMSWTVIGRKPSVAADKMTG